MEETIGFHPKPRERRVEDVYKKYVGKYVIVGVENMGIAEGVIKDTFVNHLTMNIDDEEIVIHYNSIFLFQPKPLIIRPEFY